MSHQHLQIARDILLELANALGAEGVGDSLSFTGVFRAVTCVEEASLNGDEGVIVVAMVKCLGQLWLISRERLLKSTAGVRRRL